MEIYYVIFTPSPKTGELPEFLAQFDNAEQAHDHANALNHGAGSGCVMVWAPHSCDN